MYGMIFVGHNSIDYSWTLWDTLSAACHLATMYSGARSCLVKIDMKVSSVQTLRLADGGQRYPTWKSSTFPEKPI